MMAGAHLTRSQWRAAENWNDGAVIDRFRRRREAVRDKGVATPRRKGARRPRDQATHQFP